MSEKCLVKGCNNRRGEGTFVGDLCWPCHTVLLTGSIAQSQYGETFIHDLIRRVKELEDAHRN